MLSLLLLAQTSVTTSVVTEPPETVVNLAKNPKYNQVNNGYSLLAQGESDQEVIDVIEVIADQQEYDQENQVITASGNVEVRFPKGVLTADRVKINLKDRLAVAEGEVVLRRGEQVLRGERFEYNFFEDRGIVNNASGEIFQPTLGRDFNPSLSRDESIPDQPLGDRLEADQPLRRVVGKEGYQFVIGSTRDLDLLEDTGLSSNQTGGNISRLRFQAERLDFHSQGWVAEDIRFTNDPFSPPELEVRSNTATFENISEDIGELTTTNSRIVLDQRINIPILRDNLTIDRRPRRPSLIQVGFDGEERGGLFIQSTLEPVSNDKVRFTLTPQYLLQKALFPDAFTVNNSTDLDEEGGLFSAAVFGLKSRLDARVAKRATVIATTDLPSLELSEIDNKLRAKVGIRQEWGNVGNPYLLSFEYNYRERLFNGSLGFQTVQSSLGVVLVSPRILLGDSGVVFSYQVGLQNIEAETDGGDLSTLMRFQTAVSLSKDFFLWQGEALEPTAEAGLRYTPIPVRPFLKLNTDVTGVNSLYGNGDTQPSLRFSVGLQGQIGHFSRPFLDYTGFSLRFSQGIRGDTSPFLFDRFVDTSTLSLGLTQQIYGPFRVGVQTSFSLNQDDEISTDYVLEYSRRTYNISLRYNPVLQIGSLNLRISDFNWSGNPEPFQGVQPVIQGVTR